MDNSQVTNFYSELRVQTLSSTHFHLDGSLPFIDRFVHSTKHFSRTDYVLGPGDTVVKQVLALMDLTSWPGFQTSGLHSFNLFKYCCR